MKTKPKAIEHAEVKFPCIIFDLDGTLADVSARRLAADISELNYIKTPQRTGETYHKYRKRIAREQKDMWWSEWQNPKNIELDEPNAHVVSLCKLIKEFWSCAIIITSARTDRNMSVTKDWLTKHNIYYDELFMRPDGDFSSDNVFKQRMLDKFILPKYEVLMVFDDRNQVVKMWRGNNIPCLQVADGDF